MNLNIVLNSISVVCVIFSFFFLFRTRSSHREYRAIIKSIDEERLKAQQIAESIARQENALIALQQVRAEEINKELNLSISRYK